MIQLILSDIRFLILQYKDGKIEIKELLNKLEELINEYN